MGDVSHMVFLDHNPSNTGSAPTIEPNIPVFHYASIPGHLFAAAPNGFDPAQGTRFIVLESNYLFNLFQRVRIV